MGLTATGRVVIKLTDAVNASGISQGRPLLPDCDRLTREKRAGERLWQRRRVSSSPPGRGLSPL
jgi:hypothetical protein